ncbi:MAG: bifunctional riboflavin kinase/FAD synthetase [Acidobacteria bacterium]|nr:bifunctional riboflavin kinase/FAD synthetase [Acidobacteriota bacterium]
MLVVQDAFSSSDLPRGGIGTIGNFDGVHTGQRKVIDTVVARARETGLTSMVVTFHPHPLAVLRPHEAPPAITTLEQKEKLLEEAGVEALLVVTFTEEFSRNPAEVFVRNFLHKGLDLREIYIGASFHFGHGREGNVDLLSRLGEELGFQAVGVPEVARAGERVSSTRIRRAIGEGRVEAAQEMLGRPYSITGVVTRGDRMGKRLGWPTINLTPENELLPADGVYACRAHFPSFPATFDCATNIGTRPTVYENYQRVVEAHVLDFATDVYGERVELEFHRRLREERIFPTVMDLSAQIRLDVEATREFFNVQRGLLSSD